MTVLQIASDEKAADVAARLDERRTALAALVGRLGQMEEDVADCLVARAAGERFDSKRLAHLIDQRDVLRSQVVDERMIVDGLGARLRRWSDAERERQYVRDRTALEAISAETADAEDAYVAAIEEAIRRGQALIDLQHRHDVVAAYVSSFERDHDLPTHRCRRPYSPPIPPARYLRRRVASFGEQSFGEWLKDWRRDHPR